MPIYVLSKELIDEICKGYQCLAFLNLSNNSITTIENLASLQSLTRLDLSKNCIARIQNLDCLPLLKELRLAGNCISHLDASDLNLPTLERLDLANNLIVDRKQVHSLAGLPLLRRITLQGNPVARLRNYRAGVARCLPQIHDLDSEPLHRLSSIKALGGSPSNQSYRSPPRGASPCWSLSSSTYSSSLTDSAKKAATKGPVEYITLPGRAGVDLCVDNDKASMPYEIVETGSILSEQPEVLDASLASQGCDVATTSGVSVHRLSEERSPSAEGDGVTRAARPVKRSSKIGHSKVSRALAFPDLPTTHQARLEEPEFKSPYILPLFRDDEDDDDERAPQQFGSPRSSLASFTGSPFSQNSAPQSPVQGCSEATLSGALRGRKRTVV
jgi:hypothetical protein